MLKIDTTYLRSLMKNTPLSMSMRDQLSVEKSISDCLNREFFATTCCPCSVLRDQHVHHTVRVVSLPLVHTRKKNMCLGTEATHTNYDKRYTDISIEDAALAVCVGYRLALAVQALL